MEDKNMKCYKKDYPRPQFVRDNWKTSMEPGISVLTMRTWEKKKNGMKHFRENRKSRCRLLTRPNSAGSRMKNVTIISGTIK